MIKKKWVSGECRHICKVCKYNNQCDLMRTKGEENLEIIGGFIIMVIGVALAGFIVNQIIKYIEER